MRLNIIDVTVFLTLVSSESPTRDSVQYYRQLCKSRNTLSQGSINSEQLLRTSNSMSKVSSRNKTQKKQQKLVYEIMDNKKISLYWAQSGANSYLFDHIEQTKGQISNAVEWGLNITNKNIGYREQMEIKINCNLILTYNYEIKDFCTLILGVGKRLISEGFVFQINTSFSQGHKGNRERKNSVTKLGIYTNHSQIKNIKFISEIKDYVNGLKEVSQNIQKIWITSSFFQLGVGIYYPENNSFGIDVLSKLVKDYEEFIGQRGISTNQSINFKVAISTISQVPQQTNLQRCKLNFQQALLLSKNIKQYAVQQRQFYSFSNNQSIKYNTIQNDNIFSSKVQVLRESTKQNKRNSRKSSKNSKENIKFVTFENGGKNIQKTKNKSKQIFNSEQKSHSDQSSQFSPDFIIKSKASLNGIGKQSNFANLMAQNMHLKWQLETIQKQYELQSQKFIIKNQKKYKDIIEQRSFCLQQNGRLRKDNEQLMRQVSALKHDYEAALKSRDDYEKILQEKNIQNEMTLQKRYKENIKELEQQIKYLKAENKSLQKNLNDARASLQDGRRRNRQKLEQMSEEIKMYEKFSEQIKLSYDQIEQQARLDKNRCQNLEKRCKKYQETLSDLIKLKNNGFDSSSSRNSEMQTNQIVCKAYQIINEPDTEDRKIHKTEKDTEQKLNTARRSKRNSQNKEKAKEQEQEANCLIKAKLNTKRNEQDKKQRQFNLIRVQESQSEPQKKRKTRYISFADQPPSSSDR